MSDHNNNNQSFNKQHSLPDVYVIQCLDAKHKQVYGKVIVTSKDLTSELDKLIIADEIAKSIKYIHITQV